MNQRRIAFIGIVLAAVVVAAYYCMTDKKENSKVNIGRSDIRIEDITALRRMPATPSST